MVREGDKKQKNKGRTKSDWSKGRELTLKLSLCGLEVFLYAPARQ